MANYTDEFGNPVADSENIEFVRGNRRLCLAADSILGKNNEDILFASGEKGVTSSGTIISGGIEYGLGVYYPNVSETAKSKQALGNIASGKTPDYFKGRTIGDILDEALFRKPTTLQLVKGFDPIVKNGIRYQDCNFSTIINDKTAEIKYTILADSDVRVGSDYFVTINNSPISDAVTMVSTNQDDRKLYTFTIVLRLEDLLKQKFINKYMGGDANKAHTHVFMDSNAVLTEPIDGKMNGDLFYSFKSGESSITSDDIVLKVKVNDGYFETSPFNVEVKFNAGSHQEGNMGSVTGTGTTTYSLVVSDNSGTDINLSTNKLEKLIVTVGVNDECGANIVNPKYTKPTFNHSSNVLPTVLENSPKFWTPSNVSDFYCHFNTDSEVNGDAANGNRAEVPLKWTDSNGKLDGTKYLGKFNIGERTLNKTITYSINESLKNKFFVDPTDSNKVYCFNEDGTKIPTALPYNQPLTYISEYGTTSLLFKCYYVPTLKQTVTSKTATISGGTSFKLYKDTTTEQEFKITLGDVNDKYIDNLKFEVPDSDDYKIKSVRVSGITGKDVQGNTIVYTNNVKVTELTDNTFKLNYNASSATSVNDYSITVAITYQSK